MSKFSHSDEPQLQDSLISTQDAKQYCKIQGLLSLCHLLDSSFGQAVKARLYVLVHLLFKEGGPPGEVRQSFMQP